MGKLDFEDLQMHKGYDPEKAYYRSKLALLLYAYELARLYPTDKLTVNAFEPGMTKTNFSRDFQGIMKYGAKIMKLFMHGPEVPARTGVYLALSPEVSAVTGKSFYNSKQINSSPQSNDAELAKKLWAETLKQLS